MCNVTKQTVFVAEMRLKYQKPWNQGSRQLKDAMWVLVIELGFSERSASALKL